MGSTCGQCIKRLGGWGHELITAPFGSHPLLWPFNLAMQIIEFIAKTVSHGMRLFGNMFAGHMLIVLFVSAGAFFLTQGIAFKLLSVPTFVMAAAMFVFEALVQFLQAYVFTLLAASYIAGALADDH